MLSTDAGSADSLMAFRPPRLMLGKVSRRQRIVMLAAAAALAVAAVALAVTLSGSPRKATPTVAAPARSFLAGVRQRGDTLGRADAPATLLVFEDPQCPYCRDWSVGTLPSVADTFVRTGRLKLVWEGIAIVGENSVAGLRVAYAAAQQNRLWSFVDQLYRRQGAENSGWITEQVVQEACSAAGIDASAMLEEADSVTVTSDLTRAARDATRYGVRGTPTFVLVHPPAVPQLLQITGLDPTTFDAELSSALE